MLQIKLLDVPYFRNKVMDLVGWTNVDWERTLIDKLNLCSKYRQGLMDILGAEIVANPKDAVMAEGDSVDRQKDYLSFLCSKLHK